MIACFIGYHSESCQLNDVILWRSLSSVLFIFPLVVECTPSFQSGVWRLSWHWVLKWGHTSPAISSFALFTCSLTQILLIMYLIQTLKVSVYTSYYWGPRIVEERPQAQTVCKHKHCLFCRNSQHSGVYHPRKMANKILDKGIQALLKGNLGNSSVMSWSLF